MKVTVCQLDPREGQIDTYLQGLKEHIASSGSDFVLLPELCFSEWLAADNNVQAERWERSVAEHTRRIDALGELGAKAVMSTRPIVNEAGSRRNLAYIWTAEEGRAHGVREKYYLPDEDGYWEHSWYDRGEKRFDIARALGMRIGVQICTDMWFFEWARHYARSRADLLCVPRATPHGSTDKWLAGGRAAAVCSGAYCLSSNLWMPEGAEANCGGLSWIVDPEGNVLARTDESNPFATVEINLAFAAESKTTYPRDIPE